MCGREIHSRPITIKIEGAELSVCPSCAKHGERVVHSKPQRQKTTSKPYSHQRTTPSKPMSSKPFRREEQGGMLVSDYHEKIRLARQRMKLTQKEVSIQTKISTPELQSIETGKMRPPDKIVKTLERFFGIKLTEEVQSYRPKDQKKGPAQQTLGDIVVIKKKKDEE